MDVNFAQYLNNGTRFLMELLSASKMDDIEKGMVVSEFASQMESHICDWSSLPDYEYVAYSASLAYLDGRISSSLANTDLSSVDYEHAIDLCARAKDTKNLFAERRWNIPSLQNSDFDKCANVLMKRRDSISISARIIEKDRKIEELFKSAQANLSVKDCDAVLSLADELSKDLAICKQNKTAIPEILNKDTKSVVKKITSIRKIAEQKETLHQKMFEVDNQISRLAATPVTQTSQCQEVLRLCQNQKSLLAECVKKQWPKPVLKNSDVPVIEQRYRLYADMCETDQKIFQSKDMLVSEKQYKLFFGNCKKQLAYLSTCKQNKWDVPRLSVSDVLPLYETIRKEKRQRDRKKILKRTLILVSVGIVATLSLVLFCVHKYREGKVRIPFDYQFVQGRDLEYVMNELISAGFDKDKITVETDEKDWRTPGNRVSSVAIDNWRHYKKGKYVKPDVGIVVTYSGKNKIEITDLLENWNNRNYEEVVDVLKEAGFTNINPKKEEQTSDKEKDQLVAEILIDEHHYDNEKYFIPSNTPITVVHYTLKLKIGDVIGKDYHAVVEDLSNRGFTDISTQVVNDGMARSGTVVGVKIDGNISTGFNADLDPNVKLVVQHSSEGRDNATNIVKDWKNQNYDALRDALVNAGFTKTSVHEVETQDVSLNYHVSSITFNNEPYTEGGCYVPKTCPIVIEYYSLQIVVGDRLDGIDKYSEMSYVAVKNALMEMGFENVTLYRTDTLINGWWNKEGSIQSLTINGLEEFGDTSFKYDVPVKIVVYTFENEGCEDISNKYNP